MKNEIFRTHFYDYYVVSFNRINARMLVIGCRGKKGAPVVYKVDEMNIGTVKRQIARRCSFVRS